MASRPPFDAPIGSTIWNLNGQKGVVLAPFQPYLGGWKIKVGVGNPRWNNRHERYARYWQAENVQKTKPSKRG